MSNLNTNILKRSKQPQQGGETGGKKPKLDYKIAQFCELLNSEKLINFRKFCE